MVVSHKPIMIAAAAPLRGPLTCASNPTRTPNRIPATVPGMTRSGQPGSPENVYRHHGPDVGSIIRAALDLAS